MCATTALAIILVSSCESPNAEREKAVVRVSQPDGSSKTVQIDTDGLAKSTEPRNAALTFQTGHCAPHLGTDMPCVSVYSTPQNHNNALSIDDFDESVEILAVAGPFTICVDDGVSNQLLVDVMAIVKSESLTGQFSINRYPCM